MCCVLLLQHRKIAVNFRDSALQKIFQMSLTACRQLLQQGAGQQMQSEALALAQCCLNFDFVGTCLDDTTEDVTTIQVGKGWHGMMQRSCRLEAWPAMFVIQHTEGGTSSSCAVIILACSVMVSGSRALHAGMIINRHNQRTSSRHKARCCCQPHLSALC
jgi:hypothetical protein